MTLRLVTLEGETKRTPGDLIPISKDESHALFGDSEDAFRFRVSLSGDQIETYEWSNLHQTHLPFNNGTEYSSSILAGEEEGAFWHLDEDNNLLGSSVCVCDTEETLNGEENEYYLHYNLDGSLAGYSIQRPSGDYVTLSGAVDLSGFGFKGLKMPSFKGIKIKAPKIKFKAPKIKFKAPKLKFKAPKLPKLNTRGISKSVSSIGKGVSNAVSSVSKGIGNVGTQIGKGVQKHFSNLAEGIGKVGELANQALDTASSFLSPGGEGLPEEGSEEEEQITDPTIPGYTDEDGYTADDGLYYTNDGTLYQDPQTGEWFNIDGTPYGTEEQIVSEASEVYGEIDEENFLPELGFDLSSLSSLASNPMVSMGLNAVLPGSGMALSAVTGMAAQGKQRKKVNKKPARLISNLSTLNRLTNAKKQNRQIAITQPKASTKAPPPRPNPPSKELMETIRSVTGVQQQQTPKEDKTKTYLMIGGGSLVALTAIYLISKGGSNGKR